MLSPGDKVLVDGETDITEVWTVCAVVEGVEFSDGSPTNLHTLSRGKEAKYGVPARRITGHVVYG